MQGMIPRGIVIGTLLGNVQYLSMSPDDGTVAACTDAKIYMLNSKYEEVFTILKGHLGSVTAAEFCSWQPDILVSVSEDRTFKVWNQINGEVLYQSSVLSASPLLSLCISEEHKQLITGSGDGQVWVFSLLDGQQYRLVIQVDLQKTEQRYLRNMELKQKQLSKSASPTKNTLGGEERMETTKPVLRITPYKHFPVLNEEAIRTPLLPTSPLNFELTKREDSKPACQKKSEVSKVGDKASQTDLLAPTTNGPAEHSAEDSSAHIGVDQHSENSRDNGTPGNTEHTEHKGSKKEVQTFALFNTPSSQQSSCRYYTVKVPLKVHRKGQGVSSVEADWLDHMTQHFTNGALLVDGYFHLEAENGTVSVNYIYILIIVQVAGEQGVKFVGFIQQYGFPVNSNAHSSEAESSSLHCSLSTEKEESSQNVSPESRPGSVEVSDCESNQAAGTETNCEQVESRSGDVEVNVAQQVTEKLSQTLSKENEGQIKTMNFAELAEVSKVGDKASQTDSLAPTTNGPAEHSAEDSSEHIGVDQHSENSRDNGTPGNTEHTEHKGLKKGT
ncbi:UNVERIFIED_CONTAM: hypothetical protein FKN15_061366 [Acipenser sinensis]